MPGPLDLTGQKIRLTYQRVVQYSAGNLYDGLGNVLPIGSITLTGEDYLSLTGQEITAHPVNLATSNVTGRLPYANIAQVTAHKLLGNPTSSTANVSEITLGTNLSFSGSTLNASLTEADPVFTAWLAGPPNISIFTNNAGYLTTISGIAAGGELSGTYPNPTLLNSAVIGKVLTGLSITGGTISSTDSIVGAFGKIQNQLNALVGGVIYKGTWNASTNTPTLTDGTGIQGWYYVVSTGATRNLGSGAIDFNIGDWVIHNGTIWQKVDNTDAITSLGVIGSVPNASGATLSSGTFNLEPASASFGGVVTTGAQEFGGAKSFKDSLVVKNSNAGTGNWTLFSFNVNSSGEHGMYDNLTGKMIATHIPGTNTYFYGNGGILYDDTNFQAVFKTPLADGVYISGNIVGDEVGIYAQSSDEQIATYNTTDNTYFYGNGYLLMDLTNQFSTFTSDLLVNGQTDFSYQNFQVYTNTNNSHIKFGKYDGDATDNGALDIFLAGDGYGTTHQFAMNPEEGITLLSNITGNSSGIYMSFGNTQYIATLFHSFDGLIKIDTLQTSVTAPATSGTTKMVITDVNGQLSFTDLPTGTVTSVSIVSANGFAGSSSGGSTPALTISTTVTGILKGNGTAISAATSGTDYSVGTSALATGILKSTTSTGTLSIAVAADFPTLNQNTTGSAATLTTSRNINGVAFNGSADITITAAAGTLTGTTLNSTVVTSSLTSHGTITSGGLGTGAVIGGVTMTLGSDASYDIYYRNSSGILTRLANGTTGQLLTATTGSAPSWVAMAAAAAGTLTGTTLASNVVTSSLTSVGTISTGVWQGTTTDRYQLAITALGSAIVAQNIDGNLSTVLNNASMTSLRTYWQAVYIDKAQTITGVKWRQAVQGVYTAQTYNGVGLYSYNTGTGVLTLVASSTDDGNIWKAAVSTAGSLASKAFSSTYAATPGIYFVCCVYSSSAQTTAPSLGIIIASPTTFNINVGANDFSNSAKTNGIISGLGALPSPTQAMSGITAYANAEFWFGLY